jgi:hypothetical protein
MFSVFTPYATTVKIEISSLSNYTDLLAQSLKSFQCPCSQISIKYKSFLNIEARFHQVCSSDFVSDRWIKHLYGDKQPVYRFNSTDFYYSASGQFQLLASLCELSKETVNSSILQLNGNDFINTQLLSPSLFNDRIRTTINQWRREGVKAGGVRPVKMGERPKMFAPSDVHYFFRKNFLSSAEIFQLKTFFFFFALHTGFSGFQEISPVTFAPKWEKMTQNERK